MDNRGQTTNDENIGKLLAQIRQSLHISKKWASRSHYLKVRGRLRLAYIVILSGLRQLPHIRIRMQARLLQSIECYDQTVQMHKLTQSKKKGKDQEFSMAAYLLYCLFALWRILFLTMTLSQYIHLLWIHSLKKSTNKQVKKSSYSRY